MATSKKKEKALEAFDLTVYPLNFVVAIGDMEDEVNEKYMPANPDYNYIGGPNNDVDASTYPVKDKATGKRCVLVWFASAHEVTATNMAHECAHAAMEVFSYVEAKVDLRNQEPFAYLVGSLARMVAKVFYSLANVVAPEVK